MIETKKVRGTKYDRGNSKYGNERSIALASRAEGKTTPDT